MLLRVMLCHFVPHLAVWVAAVCNRMVVIRGKPDAVNRAINMVTELIKGEPGSATQIIQKYGLGSALQVSCPKAIVGRIIGKGGETIKGLQRKYHVSIQIDQVGAAVVLVRACAGCKDIFKDVDHPAAQGWFLRTCVDCDAASTCRCNHGRAAVQQAPYRLAEAAVQQPVLQVLIPFNDDAAA
jgi:hypothetical protein